MDGTCGAVIALLIKAVWLNEGTNSTTDYRELSRHFAVR